MKNLEIIEMNKVSHFLVAQQKISDTIAAALADFASFYGLPTDNITEKTQLLAIVIGSERGFCGSFNESILDYLAEMNQTQPPDQIIAIGRKLALKFENDPRLVAAIDGPNATEEISSVISELSQKLLKFSTLRWMLIYQDGGESQLQPKVVFPLENQPAAGKPSFAYPPLLYLAPPELYPKLMEQHLFAMLYRVFYLSFMAENRERLRHMDGALGKIEKDWEQMMLHLNTLRQEA